MPFMRFTITLLLSSAKSGRGTDCKYLLRDVIVGVASLDGLQVQLLRPTHLDGPRVAHLEQLRQRPPELPSLAWREQLVTRGKVRC